MFRYALLLLLISWASFADVVRQKESLETLVKKALPVSLQHLQPDKTTRVTAEKLLGKPLSGSSPSVSYYQLAQKSTRSNDLTLGFGAKNKLRYYYYKLPTIPAQKHYRLSSFEELIPRGALNRAMEKLKEDSRKADAGRILDIAIPEKGLLLKFHLSDDPTLDAVMVWKAGEKMP